MFTSGFTAYPENVEGQSETLAWMQAQAKRINAAIVGSIAYQLPSAQCRQGKPAFVNRLLWVSPNGHHYFYDKVHLFRVANEHERYQAGKERVILNYKGWRILLSTCYDLRFPVFCRNRGDYDLMLCVANWPKTRR